MDYLILNDIPTPWREPVFERVYNALGGAVRVVYFKSNEKRRLWSFRPGDYPKTILRGLTITVGETERFLNPGIVPLLLRLRPRLALLATCLKDPTFWPALAILKAMGAKIALLEDTWEGRDRGIGRLQKMARRLVYATGDAFVGTSCQALALIGQYRRGLRPEQCFLSHLVADNDHFRSRLTSQAGERLYDVMFSGRIVAVKNPEFFARVCAGIKTRLGRCRVLIIGEGEASLKAAMKAVFETHGVEFTFAGFIPHEQLPDYYARARLLLLPTSGDCWGVVLNEAMLAGTPVVTTPLTAAAGELVLDGENGRILPLDLDAWIETTAGLLLDDEEWSRYSQNACRKVSEFSFNTAASGILAAFRYLEGR
jgi:glycosyltransferase involved in cell wall biosynthesis